MAKAELAAILDEGPGFPEPQPLLEQIRTPGLLAAQLTQEMQWDGALDGDVLDLGCGTGVLSMACLLRGAKRAIGVDIDADALALARHWSERLRLANKFETIEGDVSKVDLPDVPTVIMNPPFGANHRNRNSDRVFMDRALEVAQDSIWLLQLTRNEGFLNAYVREHRASIERVGRWDYPMPRTMDHHTRDVIHVDVGAYRIQV